MKKKNIVSYSIVINMPLIITVFNHIFNNLLIAIVFGVSLSLIFISYALGILNPQLNRNKKIIIYTLGIIGICYNNLILIKDLLDAIMFSFSIIIIFTSLFLIINLKEN